METNLTGLSIIGSGRGKPNSRTFSAFDPKTGEEIGPQFFSADPQELQKAVDLAEAARIGYGKLSGLEKARFLRKIAETIENLGDVLIERASMETGLPNARFIGERGRTCSQLRMFADLLEEGSWVDARIDRADPLRQPAAKPDVRSMLRPIGPVAVFCAGNFPLAFSVAGGDTASALAAGCPVVVNAHNSHPGTAELVGLAIRRAVEETGLPEGVFSLLFSKDYEIGQGLVGHPSIRAVGFTGSLKGGRALMDIAARRKEPIPVYAEMGSINPVFLLPGAMREKTEEIAAGLHGSFNLGFGQFCTKPGVVFASDDENFLPFSAKLAELTLETGSAPLLSGKIRDSFLEGIEERVKSAGLVYGSSALDGFAVNSAFFQTDAETFLENGGLQGEIFGPTTLLVKADNKENLLEIARTLEGQLTATVHGTEKDLAEFSDLIEILETKAGRLIFNGFPTGVEVCPAMVHGGVFPATSDSRSTSVGTRATERFARLVCFQDFPQNSLPVELRDHNPLGIHRLIDGEFSRVPI
ncbi:MAG: aldehyde dehydrogenase (NADP(+)) [Pyrinomonadaceae bacterium]